MKKGKSLSILSFAVFTVMAFVTVVWAERGVTDTEIRIGQWGPQTGPAALWGNVARGTGCYFQMINAEGGIHGRKITYFLRDDGYMPPKTKAVVKELVENKKVFGIACGLGTATGMAVKKYLHTKKVPWVGPAAGSTHWAYPPTRYLFGVYPLYCDEAAILVNYAVKTLGKRRIGFFYQNDDYGKVGLYGAEVALEKLGKEIVARVPVETMDTDLSSHCIKLKAAECDCVLLWVTPKHGAIMLMTAAKMGFKPQWMASSSLSDTPAMYKVSRGLYKDVIHAAIAELPDSHYPLLEKYKRAQERFAPKERFSPFFYAGFGFVEPMVEGLRRCGRDLTVENFVRAMETIRDFKGIGPKISYGPNERQGSRSSFLARCVEGGRGERISDWMTSDIDVYEVIKRIGR
jgi:ABC-type branched-subunit amino acid transport system substrate-binding protein